MTISQNADYYDLPLVYSSEKNFNENLEFILENLQITVFFITIPFYSLIVYFIIDAIFHSIDDIATPFFRLCLTTAIIDIATYINNYIGSMFAKRGWGISIYLLLGDKFAQCYLYIAWTSGTCQALSVAVLATNRLTAILFPHRHFQMWSSWRLQIAMAVQFIPGILAGLWTFCNPARLYRNDKNGVVPKFTDDNLTTQFFIAAGFVFASICLYLIFSYVFLFIELRRNNNILKNAMIESYRKQLRRREMKLFFMSSIVVGLQIAAVILFATYGISFLKISTEEFYLLYNLTNDIMSGINPYLLWIFSDALRQYVYVRLGFVKKKVTITATVTVF